MDSILKMLMSQVADKNLGDISRQLGKDEGTTGKALNDAVPSLLMALAKNSANPEGARSLSNALSKDHDGSILDNIGGFLGNAQAGPGAGILRHVLGEKRGAVEQGLSSRSGLDASSVGKLLEMVAPLILGQLGKAKRERNLDSNGLADLLQGERRYVERQSPEPMSMIGKLLDMDGDGSAADDAARIGFNIFKRFFGKR